MITIGKVGEITIHVINTLKLSLSPGTPIYIGQTNVDHMLNTHKSDYLKYGDYISQIIDDPDFVGINSSDNSLEYVKRFAEYDDFVKVALRVSSTGLYFVRSLYILNPRRVQNFILKGTLNPLTKQDVIPYNLTLVSDTQKW